MRLIDADALIDEIEGIEPDGCTERGENLYSIDTIEEMIKLIPTVYDIDRCMKDIEKWASAKEEIKEMAKKLNELVE